MSTCPIFLHASQYIAFIDALQKSSLFAAASSGYPFIPRLGKPLGYSGYGNKKYHSMIYALP